MAGGTIDHNRIVGNIHGILYQALLDHKCEVLPSDMRIRVEAVDLFTYPDVSIVCDEPQFHPGRRDTITNPMIIFEVLSKSTKNYDRGEKFVFYRSIPTLKEYILVDQYKIHIEHFYIGGEGKWVLTEHDDGNEILKLVNIDVQIPADDIYRRVEFETS